MRLSLRKQTLSYTFSIRIPLMEGDFSPKSWNYLQKDDDDVLSQSLITWQVNFVEKHVGHFFLIVHFSVFLIISSQIMLHWFLLTFSFDAFCWVYLLLMQFCSGFCLVFRTRLDKVEVKRLKMYVTVRQSQNMTDQYAIKAKFSVCANLNSHRK